MHGLAGGSEGQLHKSSHSSTSSETPARVAWRTGGCRVDPRPRRLPPGRRRTFRCHRLHPCPPSTQAPADVEALAALKDEGNQLFARKDYEKALESYDRALKLVAPESADAALLHSNKAACHMMFKK